MVSFVPLIGIEIGVMSLVGRYMGAGNPDTAHRAAMSGLKIGWVFSAVILILFVFFPKALVAVFEPAEPDTVFDQAVPTAVFMIRTASVYVLIEAIIVVLSGALRGAGDTRFPLIATFCGIILGRLIPALIFLKLGLSVYWIFGVMIFDYGIKALLLLSRYRSRKWLDVKIDLSHEPIQHAIVDSDKNNT